MPATRKAARRKNERVTETFVREALRQHGYFDEKALIVEEQRSDVASIRRLLQSASKSGGGREGLPEFVVSSTDHHDLVIVVECKSDPRHHSSPPRGVVSEGDEDCSKRLAKFAVDGVLHYARHLSKEFTVIAIAVSGQTDAERKTSVFVHPKRGDEPRPLRTTSGATVTDILPWKELVKYATIDPAVKLSKMDDLLAFSRELHNFMRDHAKLTESEKPLLVSGTLIALQNRAFFKSFEEYRPDELQDHWLRVIREEIDKAKIPNAKKQNMVQPYSTIAVHPELGKATKAYPKGVLHELIRRLRETVWPYIRLYEDFDIVGQFYGEFLKYTGGDKKALGIVLTPRHITELCARLANVNKTSRVLDICAGTGGFLISAMHIMLRNATSDVERRAIKGKGLVGVEQQPNMFALAASNMILRGDGKANLYQGSCFDAETTDLVKTHKCNVGLLNPPFSQKDADQHELGFVKHMLDCLTTGSIGIAIVPVKCAITPHPLRDALLKDHTLDAVMTLPADLFHPVGTIACLMVFKSGIPHATSNIRTWFGYWRNDGFTKTKNKGRIDVDGQWPAIMTRWVDMYRNREVHPGESVTRQVGAADEWCAEAYMETDEASFEEANLGAVIQKYAAFRLMMTTNKSGTNAPKFRQRKWAAFPIAKFFEIKKGNRLTKANMTPGDTLFIGAIEENNGLTNRVAQAPNHSAGTITVNYNGNGVAEAFYQPLPFRATDDVNVLYPKFEMTPDVALFICMAIRQEKYRFSYGRKWHMQRMLESAIKLPVAANGEPDWKFMRECVQAFPSSRLISDEFS